MLCLSFNSLKVVTHASETATPDAIVRGLEYEDPKTKASRNKIAFFAWCPDVAKVKPKMIYASSKEELKKRLVGLACEIQGSDQGDVEFQEVVNHIIRVSK